MGSSLSVCRVFHHIVAKMVLEYVAVTVTLDTIVAVHTIFAFVIPLVILLTS
jgi:hypothetical protein